jgi:hypothetical protein
MTYILPMSFLAIDCLLLFIALIWIYQSLKHDKHVMGNEKFMLLHAVLLLVVVGSGVYTSISFGHMRAMINSGNADKTTIN